MIGLHTEFDGNPDNSQAAWATERIPIVLGAPGHCEGHNVNAAVLVATAIALKRAMERFGLKGALKVFGTPAEEQLLARPYFVHDGYFDDVDVAFHNHLGGSLSTTYGKTNSAMVSAKFTFLGETSHSAVKPWNARDALDAVVLMDMGVAQYREHMKPTMRVHRVITEGGQQPNVVPGRAQVWWYFRDLTADGARKLFEQGRKIAEGAATMTNTGVQVDVLSAVWPVRINRTLAEIVQKNIEMVGMPVWTEVEQEFARKLQAKADTEEAGQKLSISPLMLATQGASSNDSGDVTWVVPTARITFPSNVPNIPFHHWTAGAALATSIAHKGAVVGAKAFSGSVIDLLENPGSIAEVTSTFKEEISGAGYRSLLPADQQPQVGANHDMMEAWRTKMRPFYSQEPVAFT